MQMKWDNWKKNYVHMVAMLFAIIADGLWGGLADEMNCTIFLLCGMFFFAVVLKLKYFNKQKQIASRL